MGATCGAGTAYPYGWPEFTPVVSGVRFVRSLVFCVLFCRSLFVLFLLAIVLSMLWFMASDYPFGIFWPLCCLCFDLWLLITPLVPFGHCVVYALIYGFWLPLWYLLAIVLSMLWFMAFDYPFGIFWPLCCLCFDLWLLITPLVSSNFSYILIKQYKNKQKKRFPSIYFVKTSRPIGMHSSNNQIINWKSTVFFPLNIITRLRAIHQK